MTDTITLTKQQVMDTLDAARREWEETLAQVPANRLDEPGVVGEWAVKDIVAHVGYWERWSGGHVSAAMNGATATHTDLYGVEHLPDEVAAMSEDEFNQWTYDQFHNRPALQTLMEEQQHYRRLYFSLRAIREADLMAPGRFAWTRDSAVWDYVRGNTVEHWAEHAQSIRDWLSK
jgi:hypothetical protein